MKSRSHDRCGRAASAAQNPSDAGANSGTTAYVPSNPRAGERSRQHGGLHVTVPVMFSTRSAHFARKLRQMAGNAVRGGMSHTDALAAITSVPAQVFGLGSRGVLRVGSTADVVLWTGDPLDVTSWPAHLWIGGDEQTLSSRQSLLFERYRSLPGSPTAPLPLPE